MSNRGSKSAKFIGGKSWSPSNFKIGRTGKKEIKNENKKLTAFEQICKVFDTEANDLANAKYQNQFLNITNKKIRQRAITNLEGIKERIEKDERNFEIATYFNFQYHLKDLTSN